MAGGPPVRLKDEPDEEPAEYPEPGILSALPSFGTLALVLVVAVGGIGIGAIVFGGAGDVGALGGNDNASDDLESGQLVYEDATLSSSDDVARMIAYENGTLAIEFEDTNVADGWSIVHEYHDEFDDSIVHGETPRFGERIELPFASRIDASYPTGTFTMQFRSGDFCAWDSYCVTIYGDVQDTIAFDVPEAWLEEEEPADDTGNQSVTF